MRQNRNAFAGRNIEKLFCNSVGDHPRIIKAIQKEFGLTAPYIGSISTGIHGEKCDVKMSFADGRNVDVNIKGHKQVGFNQTTRTKLRNFCKTFEILNQYASDLKELFRLKAENRNRPLIPSSQRNKWREILEPIAKEIVKASISSHPSREILVLYDREDSVMRIWKMSEVLRKLDYSVDYTARGNIRIGECFQLQRKGGDGNVKTVPKTDSRHPSNDIQVKMDIKAFLKLKDLKPFTKYQI